MKMSKYGKRGIALLLAATLALGMLAGCTNKDNDTSKVDTKEKSTAQTNENENVNVEEPVEIEWLAYNCYGQPDKNSEIVKSIEEKFNVKFNFWFVDDQKWDEVLGVKLSSGDMPDILRIKNTANMTTYVKQGVLAEITDEILDKAPTFMKYKEEYDPEDTALIDCYIDGKLYGIKNPSPQGAYPTVLTWRVDWLNNVGIDKIPTTLDEFEEAIYAFTNDDPDGNGKADTFGLSNTTMNAIFGAFGPIPLKEFRGTGTQNLFYMMKDDKLNFACVQPEMKIALEKLQKWYQDGIIDPEFITGENKSGYWATSQDFENGKVGVTGMTLSTHWKTPETEGAPGGAVYDSFMAVNPDAKWGETIDIGPAIVGPEGASGTHEWGAYGTAALGLTTKCVQDPRKVDAIMAMIEANNTDFDNYVASFWGVKGTHFEIDGTGTYVRKEPYTSNEACMKEGISVLNICESPDFQKDVNKSNFEWLDEYKCEGYSDYLVPQTEAANQYLADLKTYALDAYIKIITGEESIDYFDTFTAQFLEKGGQEILDEINAQAK